MSDQLQTPLPKASLTYGLSDTPGFFCVVVHLNGEGTVAHIDKDSALALQAALLQFIDIEEERERDDV